MSPMSLLRAPIFAVAVMAWPAMANADVCVTCVGPAAVYACAVKKAEQIEALAGAKTLNKICAQVLKRKGQHASCEAADTASCPGTPTTVGWKEVKEALASGEAEPDKPAKAVSSTADKAATPSPSKTVAKEKAQHPVSSASAQPLATPVPKPPAPEVKVPPPEDPSFGEKLKGSAEKTWKCVSSFFGDC